MAKITIILEGRVLNYVENISKNYPEIWDKLKPDKIKIEIDGKNQCSWLNGEPQD